MEKQRLDYFGTAPESYKAMKVFSDYLKTCGLEHPLLELIKIRASQMNGCAFCLDMHMKDARAAGETEERLYMLNAWRESGLYSDRERAALAWTEALTFLGESQASKDIYDEVAKHFSPKETADVTHAIAVINSWNRLMMAFRVPPGRYQPKSKG
ncbi:MAG TPA: carboxymuconolactone decarboxylase family protein [bacterium]|nr:carboxymuconolactone decarboxylase family protein [bacterium]